MNPYFSKEFTVSNTKLSVKKENILKSLEVPSHQPDPYVNELIDDLFQQSLKISSPRCRYVLIEEPVFKNKIEMIVGGQSFILNKIVLSALKESSYISFFIGTAGVEIQQFSKQLIKDGHTLEGLIVDLIGSEIAEEVAEYIHKKIEQDMRLRGMSITNRYSPGYCNWHVSDQQKLFKILEGRTCGIQLSDSSLMLPLKSVSGIIGVGNNVKNRGYTCSKCEMDFCIYRVKDKFG